MDSFCEYFSPRAIIEELIRIRTNTARKRHEGHFLARISRHAPDPTKAVSGSADHLLPPRRQWRRPKADKRAGLSKSALTGMAIRRAVSLHMARGNLSSQGWGRNLLCFIGDIQRAATEAHKIEAPSIFLRGKDSARKTYRPIAIYTNIKDRVILGITARYLRDAFDDDLLPCAYAFRTKPSFSHNAAVRGLRDYRVRHGGETIYAAECDIQKFFDTVNQRVALAAVEQAVSRAKARGISVDSRALNTLASYLESYTFRAAREKGEAQLRAQGLSGTIEYLDAQTLAGMYADPDAEKLGIPQGGAMSPLLANLVLDAADRDVVAAAGGGDFFFARFCDDMIILHPDRAACLDIFNKYQAALARVKVAVHSPKEIAKYDAAVFSDKSKQPYAWARPDGQGRIVPWVSFLGYQIKYDGKLRVRPGSVRREHDKQIRVVGKVLRLVDKGSEGLHLGAAEIGNRTHLRLIAMSIGLNKLRADGQGRRQPCWADAFYLLDANESSTGQLRSLDRNRERQMRRLVRRLRRLGLLKKDEGRETAAAFAPRYYGAPYSYHSCVGPSERKEVRVSDREVYSR